MYYVRTQATGDEDEPQHEQPSAPAVPAAGRCGRRTSPQ
jgi:hypothetical protein